MLAAFGSSMDEDMLLARFDVLVSRAHVGALRSAGIVSCETAETLLHALRTVDAEIEAGSFEPFARASGAEDVHGAIDLRVRELCSDGAGEWLHAGRSRNDQVATTLLLYSRDRAKRGRALSLAIARTFVSRAKVELRAGTLFCATTHWQPAQPALLAFWLAAAAQPFVRAARRFGEAAVACALECPLGSAALAGTTLPLDRELEARELGFAGPSRNALDSVGNRDGVLDVAHGFVRAAVDASRSAGELVVWCTPAFGYARCGDASSTGSSLMPQKRNPDAFELVRATAAELAGEYAGALGTLCGLALSYHRDLQRTKRVAMGIVERGAAVLEAFRAALLDLELDRTAMNSRADEGYALATDFSDALVRAGVPARRSHQLVGERVALAEREERPLEGPDLEALADAARSEAVRAPLSALASVQAKRTAGSTHPDAVAETIARIEADIEEHHT